LSFLNVDIKRVEISDTFDLHDIKFQLQENKILSIVGRSGSGKSSLLKTILGVYKADGCIQIQGSDISHLEIEDRPIGIIFQDFALFPFLTVEKNILLSNSDKDLFLSLCQTLKIKHLIQKYPSEISGGEKQRVAIARSLMAKPKVLLFDEPFSSLDQDLKYHLRYELKKILSDMKITAIFVMHDLDDAFYLSDDLMIMDKGQIVEVNECDKILNNPHIKSQDFLHMGLLLCETLQRHLMTDKKYCRFYDIKLVEDSNGFPLVMKKDLGLYILYSLQIKNRIIDIYSQQKVDGPLINLQLC